MNRSAQEPTLPIGVWRRAKHDWAYRIEIKGYGIVCGLGFTTKQEAQQAMRETRKSAALGDGS